MNFNCNQDFDRLLVLLGYLMKTDQSNINIYFKRNQRNTNTEIPKQKVNVIQKSGQEYF